MARRMWGWLAPAVLAAVFSHAMGGGTALGQSRSSASVQPEAIHMSCSATVMDPIEAARAMPMHGRRALIISNQKYDNKVIADLETPHADGERMCLALVAIGFRVRHVKEADFATFDREIRAHLRRLADDARNPQDASTQASSGEGEDGTPGLTGFIYFSGHGATQFEGGPNYLIPVREKIERSEHLTLGGVNLDALITQIRNAATNDGVRQSFLVIDACRNIAFPGTKGGSRGFSPVSEQSGMMIGFSTAPGQTAQDAAHYSTALADELRKKRDAYVAFREVRRRVLEATDNRQFPWTHDGLLDRFHFYGDKTPQDPLPRRSPDPNAQVVEVSKGMPMVTDCAQCPPMRVIPTHTSNNPALKDFAIGLYEVTFDDWQRCVDGGKLGGKCVMPDDAGFGRGRRPVINITWSEAQTYIDWLNQQQDKYIYRLPTDLEWTFAATGGGDGVYPHGNEPATLCGYAHGDIDRTSNQPGCRDGTARGTRAVGGRQPTGQGLYDMAGNVAEFVDGCHDGSKIRAGRNDRCARTLRGGSWRSGADAMKTAARRAVPTDFASNTAGFRLARDNR